MPHEQFSYYLLRLSDRDRDFQAWLFDEVVTEEDREKLSQAKRILETVLHFVDFISLKEKLSSENQETDDSLDALMRSGSEFISFYTELQLLSDFFFLLYETVKKTVPRVSPEVEGSSIFSRQTAIAVLFLEILAELLYDLDMKKVIKSIPAQQAQKEKKPVPASLLRVKKNIEALMSMYAHFLQNKFPEAAIQYLDTKMSSLQESLKQQPEVSPDQERVKQAIASYNLIKNAFNGAGV